MRFDSVRFVLSLHTYIYPLLFDTLRRTGGVWLRGVSADSRNGLRLWDLQGGRAAMGDCETWNGLDIAPRAQAAAALAAVGGMQIDSFSLTASRRHGR